MNTHKKDRNDDGIALVLSLIFLIGMSILLAGLIERAKNQSRQVETYIDYEDALQGVEAGFALARLELHNEQDGNIGINPVDTTGLTRPPLFNIHDFDSNTNITPQTIDILPGVEFFTYTLAWATDGMDNNGDGNIDGADPAETDWFSIYSFARAPSAFRMAEMTLNGSNVNVWNNAVFGGSGQTGNLINGNVSIHGSVHLLGDSLGAGGVAVESIDLSGTSLIHNNYDGLPAAMRPMIPPLETVDIGGVPCETLNAILRVKQGLVGISGNSEIGQDPATAPAGIKPTMDGIFATDGWTGNGLDAQGNPINVYSDNGYSEVYDLGGAVPYPTFGDDSGTNHLETYLTPGAAGEGLHAVYSGDMHIITTDSYYWNATTGTEVIDEAQGVGGMPVLADVIAEADDFFVWYDAPTDHMVINGRIPIDGNIFIEQGNGAGFRDPMNYTGRGTFLAFDAATRLTDEGRSLDGTKGNVTVESSLLTVNANGTTALSFPMNNLIGMMASNNLTIGVSAQIEVMGGFYAMNQVYSDKQNVILGTLVGDFFNMGTNVPGIYQVPSLKDAWTGSQIMIGAAETLVFAPQSWRELGVL